MSIPFRACLDLVEGAEDGDFQKVWYVAGNVRHAPAGPVIEFESVSAIMEHYPQKVDGKYPRLRKGWVIQPIGNETATLEWITERTNDDREDWKEKILLLVTDKHDDELPVAPTVHLSPHAVKRLSHQAVPELIHT